MPDPLSLAAIMNRHGTDKLWAHHYEDEYELHFAPRRHDHLLLLEIGIGGYRVPGRGGESLRTWADYFPNAQIHGIDIEDKSFLDGDRIHTHIADQSKPEALAAVVREIGTPDIIIDDGSHVQRDCINSYYTLFPLLKSGGIYVTEDLATAFSPEHGGDPNQQLGGPQSFLSSLQGDLDILMRSGSRLSNIRSIHFSQELVFITKW